ncbi:transposase domain containing protein [Nephila pilipes]|uniref:Transposase domain containing protein n=1 Tax=Nephila pilipes TaxID=299642 RepID=A0A8X6NC15_NEPPI|nr:transposase domain containing protein [Nephila pilipes]
MGRQLRVQRPPIRNISDLRDRCLNIWYNLSPVIYQGLVASMPRRVEAVCRAKDFLSGEVPHTIFSTHFQYVLAKGRPIEFLLSGDLEGSISF